MRQPLWIINISLISLFLVSELILLILYVSIPRRFSLQPDQVKIEEKVTTFDVEIQKIYGVNDLFGTYVPEVPVILPGLAEEKIPDIPIAPTPIPLKIPIEKAPVFIAPLTATLKGVIYLHDDPDKSIAIIMFKDSKQEHNYHVGEMIQDAQILKIYPNRIIVVRSNGQQETLFLREQDAKQDLVYDEQKALESFKVIVHDDKRHVPLDLFLKQVHSLGQFIDMLDLITVYKKGKSVGCRVGKAAKDTLGGKLGFEVDDLITKVDNLVVTDLHSRVAIYDHLIAKKIGDTITIEIKRNDQDKTMIFVLSHDKNIADASSTVKELTKGHVSETMIYNTEQEKQKILEQRIKLAPTVNQIQMDEQRKLLEARKKMLMSK